MLSWLTGAKCSEETTIPHCDSFIDAPETPAPVFAVRAFKHALFGTPRPSEVDVHDRFDSIAADTAKNTLSTKTADLAISPRRKHDDVKAMALPDALGFSPSKPNGILMTPGTTRRNKTVTFGSQVVDNEGKKASRSGLPSTCPGKFPSPWTPKTDANGMSDVASTGSQKRTKLTQTLHDVRDSSRSRSQSDKLVVKSKDDLDITLDFMEPRSQSGKYWKQEYDAYAEKTQREVKKLLVKQKIAKDFAKDKDAEVLSLAEKLRLEQSKVERLEARNKELEVDMMELKKRHGLGNSVRPSDESKKAQNEAAKLRLEDWKKREDLERAQKKITSAQPSPRKRPTSAAKADIWADAVLSSPFIVDAAEKSPKASARPETGPKSPSPLSSRDINTLDADQRLSRSRQDPMLDLKLTPKRNLSRSTPRSSRDSQILPEDSFDMSLALPQPSPEPLHRTPPRSANRVSCSARKTAAEKTVDELLERYSPTKSAILSSPPPKFDRLAIPMGMPSTKPTTSNTQQQAQRKKPSPKESYTKAASPHADTVATRPDGANLLNHKTKVETGRNEIDEEKGQKRKISEEKRQAALDRIAARRAAKTKAA